MEHLIIVKVTFSLEQQDNKKAGISR